MTKDLDLQLNSVSSFNFKNKYATSAQATPTEGGIAKIPVVSDIVPLNRTDTVLITIEKKRYLIFNYVVGEVIKEIQPLRGSQFSACSDFMFDIKKQPSIIFYNSNSIRRIDIQTFEIKKNIDLNRISGFTGSHNQAFCQPPLL